MKRTHLIASFALALIFLLTMVVPAMAAKPVDGGYSWASTCEAFDDADGNDWYIDVYSYYGPPLHDGVIICSNDLGINIEDYGYQIVNCRINMKRGIARFQSSYCDLTVTCTNSTKFVSVGSRKEKRWDTCYDLGPGTIKGTVTYEQTVYEVDITISGDGLYLEDFHDIVK